MKRVLCWMFGHDLYLVKRLSAAAEKLYCRRCKRFYAINHDVRVFLPWDDVKSFYWPEEQ